MSFINPNNIHNHVINQLSNRPSNASELELFKRISSSRTSSLESSVRNAINTMQSTVESSDHTIRNSAIMDNYTDSLNKIRDGTNSIIKSNGSIKMTINGSSDIPLHRIMSDDEFKLFFNDQLNKQISINSDDGGRFSEKHENSVHNLIDPNNFRKNTLNSLLSASSSQKKPSNYHILNSQHENVTNDSSLRQSIDDDYELLNITQIESEPQSILTHWPIDINTNPKELRLKFVLFNRTFQLDLELNNQLFAPNFNVQKRAKKLFENLDSINLNCFYHGRLRTDISSTNFEPALSEESIVAEQQQNSNRSSIVDGHRTKKLNFTDSTNVNIVSLSNCANGALRGFIQTHDYLYIMNPLNEQLIRRHNLLNKKQLNKNILLVKRTKNKDLINNLTKQITNQMRTEKAATSGQKSEHDALAKEVNLNAVQFKHKLNEQKSNHQIARSAKRTKRSTYGQIRLDYQNPTIELAVFGDESLYNYLKNTYFIKTDHQIVTFILTILNGIQSLYNQFHKYDIDLKFKIVLLEIFEKQPKDLIPTDLQEKYLFRFCDWQAKRKYENTRSRFGKWDHAFLLTALDLARYDKETNKKVDSVIGSAMVGKMCTESSCSIGEGTLLGTVFVMTHEIGHSMDLSHDGDMDHSGTNNCQNEKYIMTSSLGPGVYSFSPCSARELKDYLRKPNAKCLFVNNSKLRLKRKFLNEFHITNEDDVLTYWEGSKLMAGQAYSMDDQCKLVFGENAFYAATKYYTRCEAVTCSTYEGIRYAHPTLEGTICNPFSRAWCRKGECVKSSLREIDSKDSLHNEISNTMNPYSLDLLTSNKAKKSNQKSLTANKPKWKIFENNHDTTVNQRLLNHTLNINQTSLSLTADYKDKMIIDKVTNVTNVNLINNNDTQIVSKINKKFHSRTESETNLTNLASYWINLFDKKNNGNFSESINNEKQNHQGWSNWSYWSNCVSECVISNERKQPVGFQISTRKCYSNNCNGQRVRLKLCDSSEICSNLNNHKNKKQIKTINQYLNTICDNRANELNQSDAIKLNGCFIENCPNNELVLSHELQLPNTSPCPLNKRTVDMNSYCYNGECRKFDCSGLSDAIDTKPCEDMTTVESVVVKEENQNSSNAWHPLSYCKQSCLLKSRGIQLVYQDCESNSECNSHERQTFQLCSTAEEDCLKRELKSANDYANEICSKYKSRYSTLLSGKGKQLSPRKDNIHSACIVYCGDLNSPNIYYEMNSIIDGYFPAGTNCTFDSSIHSYCVNGRCLQFGNDLTPSHKINVNFGKPSSIETMHLNRHRRSIEVL